MKPPLAGPSRFSLLRWVPIVIAAIVIAGAATWYLDRQAGSPYANASSNSMHSTTDKKGKANRLIKEKSPYLLQHAYNPVDWYPWGEEAFEKARKDDKPIFLSIGYSTCHWCHVMERESFEDDSIAALMNEFFVAIKVDREERPDIDRIYMTAMQAMGQGGGWPLNVFLTPDLEPFYGGTYFPPRARYGRPGMPELVTRVHEAWTTQRQQIEDTGAQVLDALAGMSNPKGESPEREALLEKAYGQLSKSYDAAQGGFGNAPKFPSIVNLNFLMRHWARDPSTREQALAMSLRQLDAMRAGGIHDHLGGGFHRYSTDARWLVPHFEKMLYDQAQIAWGYLEGFQATGRKEYGATARAIFEYVARDLSSPAGGFYSAEDADSEGEEGKFYVWTPAETEAVLGKDAAAILDFHYDVSATGNFEGASILNQVHTLDETAEKFGQSVEAIEQSLAASRAKLLAARGQRIRPHLDDKVLTAWNGIMISAFARGARALDDPALAERAAAAAQFIWDKLHNDRTGEMTRRWRDGHAFGAGQLDDYVYYALGLMDLYAATFEPRWLERAARVTDSAVERFWDEEDGAFFESPGTDASIKVRMKDTFDGAEMAGNSIAALTLLKLAAVLDRDDLREKADRMLDYFSRRMNEYPAAMPQMLVAMELERSVTRHVVVAGDPQAADTQEMIRAFNHRFLPNDDLLLVDGGSKQKALSKLASFTAPLTARKGKATAYVCVDYACQLPTTDPAAFAAQLDERP